MNWRDFIIGVVVGLIIADYGHLRFRMIQSTRQAKKGGKMPVMPSQGVLAALGQYPNYNQQTTIKPLSKLRKDKATK